MENNNNPQGITTEAGQQILDQFLVENNIPCTADCIVDELNTDTCNLGLFNANSITVERRGTSIVFTDSNNNQFLVRYSEIDELMGWKRYAADDDFRNFAEMRISRRDMEVSGGEDVVWQIGLNLALVVEFGTNGINDEVAASTAEVERLEQEMGE